MYTHTYPLTLGRYPFDQSFNRVMAITASLLYNMLLRKLENFKNTI